MTEPEASTNEAKLPTTPFPDPAANGQADPPPLFNPSDLPDTPPSKRTVRLWKPEGEEFTLDHDYAQLVVDLGEEDFGLVQFELIDEAKGGQPGHTLIASLLTQI